MIRTKIIATMGPACDDVETIRQMLEAGMDVCRLNFSHGTLDEHLKMLRQIREAATRHSHPVAILGDLCGPKIRLGPVDDTDGSGGMAIEIGEPLVIQRQPVAGRAGRVSTNYPRFVDDVKVGDRVLIEDGLIRMICTDKAEDELTCTCTAGGTLKSAKGINLPNTAVGLPAITERDWACVAWAIEHDLDYLALSFVRQVADIAQLRDYLESRGSDIHLIAKIEKVEALHDIDAIIEASNGLMVARGDLGVEMDVAEVPIVQKDLIRRCRLAAKPVIVATQMLQSMVQNSSPTRAEVSDVANAIFDGSDALMLSGETAVGRFAAGAVHTMEHVAEVTEKYLDEQGAGPGAAMRLSAQQLSAAVANGVWRMVQDLDVKLVVVWSQSGTTARIFSKAQFPVPIVAVSTDERVLRQMALHYGVIPQQMDAPGDMPRLVADVDRLVLAHHHARHGDRIVIIAGSAMGAPGMMNSVVVHTVGEAWRPTP